jgi:CDGSH-type Zn-finger protein/uncharacterized Fe-S cluster protein YjdI
MNAAKGESAMSKPRTYESAGIAVSFDGGKCIHARNCVLKLREVFDPNGRPWINPEGAPAEEVAAVIRTCPSGALTYVRKDDGLEEKAPRINRIATLENGPLAVSGDLAVGGEARNRAVLCRCGLSKSKPWCDNSHIDGGFQATGEPGVKNDKVLEETGGPLTVTPTENGPLQVAGNLQIVSGTGKRVAEATKTYLCRCGQSKNKPFCDGSHKAAGFEAEGMG